MKVLRTLAYAAIILAGLLILSSLVKAQGFAAVLGIIGYGAYLPFSLTAAAAITNQRGIIITISIIVLLSTVPCTMQDFARAIAPLGVGILSGIALQYAIRESSEETPS
jgi:heme/copper-type cytochrome/quinol oxidase subunit 1